MMQTFTGLFDSWKEFHGNMPILAVYAGLLLAYLICPKLFSAGTDRPHLPLIKTGSFFFLLCVFPLTAVLLRMYFTPYHPYENLWSLLPLLPVIAMLGSLLLMHFTEEKTSSLTNRILLYCLTAALLLFCALPLQKKENHSYLIRDHETLSALAEDVLQICEENGIAPETARIYSNREVLSYLPLSGTGLTTLYTRALWDQGLQRYSYDKSDPDLLPLLNYMDVADYNDCAFLYYEGPTGFFPAGATLTSFTDRDGKLHKDTAGNALYIFSEAKKTGAEIFILPTPESDDALNQVTPDILFLAESLDLQWTITQGYWVLYPAKS